MDTGADRPEMERPGELQPVKFKPRRAWLLDWLGALSLTCGICSLCLPLWALGLPLGIVTWNLANHDLTRMGYGLMDPAGKQVTVRALNYARLGVLTNCLMLAYWLPLFTH